MRIDSLQIDGFGVFTGAAIDALPPGLTLLHGENGAGKSTLLDFIRAALFGLELGGSKYAPPGGAPYGGSIVVSSSSGDTYRIRRNFSARKDAREEVIPLSREAPPKTSEALVGGTSRTLYSRVFGFSLEELQDAGCLSDGEIATRFYSIGGGVGSRSQADVAELLSREMLALFRPQGQVRPVNTALQEIQRIQATVEEVAAGVDLYRERSRDRSQTEVRLVEQGDRLHGLQAELDRALLLDSAWETWVQLEGNRRRLRGLPQIESFPEGGPARLEIAETELSRCRQLYEELDARRKELGEKRDAIRPELRILEQSEVIERGWRELQRYRDTVDAVPRRRLELSAGRRDLDTALQRLGPGWNVERARKFGTGLAVLASLNQFHTALDDAQKQERAKLALAEDAEARTAKATAAYTREEQDFQARWNPHPLDRSVLDRRTQAIRRARDLLQLQTKLQGNLAAVETERRDAQNTRDRAQKELDAVPSSSGAPLLWTVPALSLLAACGFYHSLAAAATFLILAGSGAAAAWLSQRRLDPKAAINRAGRESDLAEALQKLDDCSQKLTTLREQREKQQRELDKICEEQQFGAASEQLSAAEAALDQENKRRQDYEREISRLQEQKATADELMEEKRRCEVALQQSRKQKEEQAAAWRKWLVQRELPLELQPEDVERLCGAVERIRTDAGRLDSLEASVNDSEAMIRSFEAEAHALAESCGWYAEDGADRVFSELWRNLEAERQKVTEWEQLDRDLEHLAHQRESAGRQHQEWQTTLDHLLRNGGAGDAEQFRTNARIWEERQEVIRQIAGAEGRLELLSGLGDARLRMEEELRIETRETLTERVRRLEEERRGLQSELEQLQRRLGELGHEIGTLAGDRRIEDLLAEAASKQTELEALASQWAMLKTTAWLLERTRKQYEKERQPAVLQAASHQLHAITGGAYKRVLQPLEKTEERSRRGEALLVEDPNGRRKDPSHWNRGLREQVYLSLRLGYIETFAQTNESLPIIMDDILVNCDRGHTLRSAQRILDLSAQHQVLYLTCHPETLELFRSLNSELPCVKIREGRLVFQ